MQEHTLIANSGIQIITFPLRINTQEKFKMWYHEWYDTENGDQIQKAIPDISPKVLSDTLKNLETDGIIKRIVYGEVPPRVEYSLTKLGLSLMPYINNS